MVLPQLIESFKKFGEATIDRVEFLGFVELLGFVGFVEIVEFLEFVGFVEILSVA